MIPVVLDTDIGTDIDDTWALAMLLRSPELRLDAVVTSHGDTRYCALLAAKMLAFAGRPDVPVGEGSGDGQLAPDRRGQQGWVDGYAPSDYSGVYRTDGAALTVETILAACRTWGGGAVTSPTWCWVGGGWGKSRTPVRDWRRWRRPTR